MPKILLIFIFHILFSSSTFAITLKDYSSKNYEIKKVSNKRGYQILAMEQSLQAEFGEEIRYKLFFYTPMRRNKNSLIVLSPTIDGRGFLEKTLAKYFVKKGFHVLISNFEDLNARRPEFKLTSNRLKRLEEGFLAPIAAVKALLPDLMDKYSLEHIFALGASQGGIRSINLAGHIPEIEATWVHVAGGDLPNIFANSTVNQVRKWRHAHMKELGLTSKEDYKYYLTQHLENDPLQSCETNSSDIFMLISMEDKSVPTKDQLELWEACGRPKSERTNFGHVFSSVKMIFIKKKIRTYFEKYID